MSLYTYISEQNRIRYGTEFEKVLQIIINQYSDRTHFIYEILQNAEDAGATHIRFLLRRDRLLVFHNGRLFNEKDIEGVCGIANGTKEDGTRIGHFGIGFKSVYCYTELPYIYSGRYHFRIKNRLFPEEVAEMQGLQALETCIVIPFDKKEVSESVAFDEIKTALLRKITAESILILNSIGEVRIEILGNPETICINKERNPLDRKNHPDNVFALSVQTTIKHSGTGKQNNIDKDYLLFTDAEPEAATIIFNVEGKELKPVKNSKVYAFFPTAKEAHQNFYIHAPFDTTPARDNFKEGAEYGKHNIQLVKNIGELIWFAFSWMKDHEYLSVAGFNVVLPIYEYEKDDILYGIYQNSINMIREEKILPTNNKNEFKNIKDIFVPQWGVIVDSFDDQDLRVLTGKHQSSWLAKEFSTDAYNGVRTFLRQNFELRTLDWKDLVYKMDASFLKQKSLAWNERMMSAIESYCIKRESNSSHYIDASRVPLVRTSNYEQITARDASGRLLVYLNNPEIAQYRILSTFLSNENIRSFYQRALQIPSYNIEQEVIERVLPKYAGKVPAFRTNNHIRENIEDLKTIKDAIYGNPYMADQVSDKYIVTDGTGWFRPGELYIYSSDIRSGYTLVRGIESIHFLSERYFDDTVMNIRLDETFFKKIGCNAGLKEVHVTEDEYLEKVRRYQGYQVSNDLYERIFRKTYQTKRFDWSFSFQGFPEVFQKMSLKRSLEIARFLNPHADDFSITGSIVGANDQHFSGNNVDSAVAYSMIGMMLCFEKWIYIKNDDQPHRTLDVDKSDLREEYKAARHLIDNLPFKEVKDALTEFLEANIDSKEEVALAKQYLSDTDKLLKVVKAMARSDAKKAGQKGRSIKDLIENGDREQFGDSSTTGDMEIIPISEKAKEKRQKNLEKEFAESLDQRVSFSPGVSFTNRTSNAEEREFLKHEYDGRCQICFKLIKRFNGEPYFEAINIVKFNDLTGRLINSSRLGWNSLCLCPNCAAEYNYASKRISSMYQQIMEQEVEADSDETIDIEIELPEGKRRSIHYSPRHFMALKQALKSFSDIKDK